MKQVAVLGSLIIKHIEENELDEAVGVGNFGDPQIWFVADWPPKDEFNKLTDEQKKDLETRQITEIERSEIGKKRDELYPKIEEGIKAMVL